MTCPACGSESFSILHSHVRDFEHGFPVNVGFSSCKVCGWLAQTPPPTPESLKAAYPGDYRAHVSGRNASGAAALLRKLKRFQAAQLVRRLLPLLPPDRSAPILDIGCGSGHLLLELQASGFRHLIGIDQNSGLAAEFAGTGIEYRNLDMESCGDLGGTFGAIVMVNVVEHFLYPGRILSLSRKSLQPGGKVIVITPNARSLSHGVFGSCWSGLHAPRHTQVFSPGNFIRFAGRLGFNQIHEDSVVDPGSWAVSFQNWVQSLLHSEGTASGGTAWYSLALLPIWYPLAVIERLVGRASSFMAVLALATDRGGHP